MMDSIGRFFFLIDASEGSNIAEIIFRFSFIIPETLLVP